MDIIIYFSLTVLFIYMIYYFRWIRYELVKNQKLKEKKKTNKKSRKPKVKDEDDIPVELRYLIYKYKVDLSKISKLKILNIIALTTAIDIGIIVNIVILFNTMILQILGGFIITMIMIFISYKLIGIYLTKKGLTTNV